MNDLKIIENNIKLYIKCLEEDPTLLNKKLKEKGDFSNDGELAAKVNDLYCFIAIDALDKLIECGKTLKEMKVLIQYPLSQKLENMQNLGTALSEIKDKIDKKLELTSADEVIIKKSSKKKKKKEK